MTDSTRPEAAHAASEYDDDRRPHLDDGAEMLGRLFIYAICVVAAVSTVAAVWPA